MSGIKLEEKPYSIIINDKNLLSGRLHVIANLNNI